MERGRVDWAVVMAVTAATAGSGLAMGCSDSHGLPRGGLGGLGGAAGLGGGSAGGGGQAGGAAGEGAAGAGAEAGAGGLSEDGGAGALGGEGGDGGEGGGPGGNGGGGTGDIPGLGGAGAGTVDVTVQSTDSIYQVFGASGSVVDDATNAQMIPFAAGADNVFKFVASGSISNCCTFFGPDGLQSPSPPLGAIVGINGLSGVQGNTALALLGVFLDETSPVGSPEPATLPYNADAPVSLSPLPAQIFYIGDGRAGFANDAGAILTFTAPPTATRLYLGIADSFDGQPPTMYGDNTGAFSVRVAKQ